MVVSYCVCAKLSLSEILKYAKKNKIDNLEHLSEDLGVGEGCGLCAEFVRYAMATGQTEVPYPCPGLPGVESCS